MNTYEIEVDVVDALGPATGKVLQVTPKPMPITLSSSTGVTENARVTWQFKNLPTGLTPAIAFDSCEVVVPGSMKAVGASPPQVTCEIRFPSSVLRGPYVANYKISLASSAAKKTDILTPPAGGSSLVIVRVPDPPPPPAGGVSVQANSNA